MENKLTTYSEQITWINIEDSRPPYDHQVLVKEESGKPFTAYLKQEDVDGLLFIPIDATIIRVDYSPGDGGGSRNIRWWCKYPSGPDSDFHVMKIV